MHDIVDLDGRSVPGVYVASTEFIDAGEAQSRSLGFHTPAVFVPHPIQDRTDAEIIALADAAVDEIVAKLIGAA